MGRGNKTSGYKRRSSRYDRRLFPRALQPHESSSARNKRGNGQSSQKRELTGGERVFLAVIAVSQLFAGLKFLSCSVVGAAAMPTKSSRPRPPTSSVNVVVSWGLRASNSTCSAQPNPASSDSAEKLGLVSAEQPVTIFHEPVVLKARSIRNRDRILQDWPAWSHKFLKLFKDGDDVDVSLLSQYLLEFIKKYPDWGNIPFIKDKIYLYEKIVAIYYGSSEDLLDVARSSLIEAKKLATKLNEDDSVKIWCDHNLPEFEATIAVRVYNLAIQAIPNKCNGNLTCQREMAIEEIYKLEPYFPVLANNESTRNKPFELYLLRYNLNVGFRRYEQAITDLEEAVKLAMRNDKAERVSRIEEIIDQIYEDMSFLDYADNKVRIGGIVRLIKQESLTVVSGAQSEEFVSNILENWQVWSDKILRLLVDGEDVNVVLLRKYMLQFEGEYPDWEEHSFIRNKIYVYRGMIYVSYYLDKSSIDMARSHLIDIKGVVARFDENDPVKIWFDNNIPVLEATIAMRVYDQALDAIPYECSDNDNCRDRKWLDELNKLIPYYSLLYDQKKDLKTFPELLLLMSEVKFRLNKDDEAIADLEEAAKLLMLNDQAKCISCIEETLRHYGIDTYNRVGENIRARIDRIVELIGPKPFAVQVQEKLLYHWPRLLALVAVILTFFGATWVISRKMKVARAIRRKLALDSQLDRVARLTDLNNITEDFVGLNWEWVEDSCYSLKLEYKNTMYARRGSFAGEICLDGSIIDFGIRALFKQLFGESNIMVTNDCLIVTLDDEKCHIKPPQHKISQIKQELVECSCEYKLHLFEQKIAEKLDECQQLKDDINEVLESLNLERVSAICDVRCKAKSRIEKLYHRDYWELIVFCDDFVSRQVEMESTTENGRAIVDSLEKICAELQQLSQENEQKLNQYANDIGLLRIGCRTIIEECKKYGQAISDGLIVLEKRHANALKLLDGDCSALEVVGKKSTPSFFDSGASSSEGSGDECNIEKEPSGPTLNAMSVGATPEKQEEAVIVVNKGRSPRREITITAEHLSEPITNIAAIIEIISVYRSSNDVSQKRQLHYVFQLYCLRLFERLKSLCYGDQRAYESVANIRNYFMHWQFNSDDLELTVVDNLMSLEQLDLLLQQIKQNLQDSEARDELRAFLRDNLLQAAEDLAQEGKSYYAVGEYAEIIREALCALQSLNISVERGLEQLPGLYAAVMVLALIGESLQKLYEIFFYATTTDIDKTNANALLVDLYAVDGSKSFWRFCCRTKGALGHNKYLQLDLKQLRQYANFEENQSMWSQAGECLKNAIDLTASFSGMSVEKVGDDGRLDYDSETETSSPILGGR
ncbi:MAG: hypothetical protein KAS93_00905 [Gammaproteobacteria bacterium]|nr:hypothetical protein [Gammaproteobacteria bacterium]